MGDSNHMTRLDLDLDADEWKRLFAFFGTIFEITLENFFYFETWSAKNFNLGLRIMLSMTLWRTEWQDCRLKITELLALFEYVC